MDFRWLTDIGIASNIVIDALEYKHFGGASNKFMMPPFSSCP